MNTEKVQMIWNELQYVDDVPENGKDGFDEFIHDIMDSRISQREVPKYLVDDIFDLQLTETELDYLWAKFMNSFEEDPYRADRLEDNALSALEEVRQG